MTWELPFKARRTRVRLSAIFLVLAGSVCIAEQAAADCSVKRMERLFDKGYSVAEVAERCDISEDEVLELLQEAETDDMEEPLSASEIQEIQTRPSNVCATPYGACQTFQPGLRGQACYCMVPPYGTLIGQMQ